MENVKGGQSNLFGVAGNTSSNDVTISFKFVQVTHEATDQGDKINMTPKKKIADVADITLNLRDAKELRTVLNAVISDMEKGVLKI